MDSELNIPQGVLGKQSLRSLRKFVGPWLYYYISINYSICRAHHSLDTLVNYWAFGENQKIICSPSFAAKVYWLKVKSQEEMRYVYLSLPWQRIKIFYSVKFIRENHEICSPEVNQQSRFLKPFMGKCSRRWNLDRMKFHLFIFKLCLPSGKLGHRPNSVKLLFAKRNFDKFWHFGRFFSCRCSLRNQLVTDGVA